MKDSMRDMLSPSWLTDLVHNVKKDSPDGDKNLPTTFLQGKGQQPGHPMQPDMESAQRQVPVPTGRFNMPGSESQPPGMGRDHSFKPRGSILENGQPKSSEFSRLGQGGINPNETMSSPFQQGNFPPPLSEFTSAQLPLARLTEKTDSTMAQEDTMSQRSDGSKSTSGCSSMVPPPDLTRQDLIGDKRKATEQSSVSTNSPTEQPSVKRQRLTVGSVSNQSFSRRLSDTFINKASTSAISHRPAFNTTLFGSPLTDEASLLGTSTLESSFYPGRTKFGGRSSLSFRSKKKSVDLNQSLPGRLSVPVKAFMKAKPRMNPSKEAVTSSTAKRILEALDKMPTPLNDAKRIPMVPRQWTESPSFFARDRPAVRSGPPTQKLNISSQISISKNRQVSFAPVTQHKPSTSRAPEQAVGKPTRQDTIVLNNEPAPSGKMRREKSYHRGSASVKTTLEEEDTVIIPNLQTDFTLPVNSMPQFSFATPTSQPKTKDPLKSREPAWQAKPQEPVPVSSESPVKQSLKFTFSSPILESIPSNKPASPQKYEAFQFSSPLSIEKHNDVSTEASDFSKPFIATPLTSARSASTPEFYLPTANDYQFSTAPKPKAKLNGPSEPSTGGFQAASELKRGSVMDILGGGGFKSSSLSSSKPTSSTPSTVGVATSKAPPLSELFKPTGWSCDVCLVNNKDSESKCVACQTPKPGAQKSKDITAATPFSAAPIQSDLMAKFQQPTGSWTCDVCLISNKPDVTKCIACQTQKPAPKLSSSAAAPIQSDLMAKFQQPTGSWTCDVCLVSNKPDVMTCIACQTQKPGAASTGPLKSTIQPGNWICNTCLIQNKQADTVCGACKTPKSNSKESQLDKSDSLFAKLKPAVGSWECETCLVQNKKEANTCVACQTPKPLKFFKHPPGEWTCDTCLVSNKESAVNCIACSYARPGPPRTHAVPSIAKSYSLSQTPGFSFPSTESSGESKLGATGFKFTPSVSSENKTSSGFDFKKMNDPSKKSEDKPVTGGFTFKADPSAPPPSSGFKFGNPASDKTSVSSTDNKETGFKIGGADSKSDNTDSSLKSAGFQFGKSDSTSSSVSNSATSSVSTAGFTFGQKSENTTSSTPAIGGFTFGKKSDNSALTDNVQATTTVPGGFNFKTSDSSSSAKSSETNKTVTTSSEGIGGFTFKTVTSPSSVAVSSNSLGAFTFTATKVTEATLLTGTKSSEGTTSAGSGFSFGQSAGQNTSSQPISFAQNSTSTTSPNKRGREDDAGEPQVKKTPFSFGPPAVSTSSTPFQFGAAATTASSTSSPFAFGQKTTTTASSAGLFAFGQQNSTVTSNTGSSVFGSSASNSTPSVFGSSAPASNGVPTVFGQQNTSVTSSSLVFGGQKSTESSNASGSVFGTSNSAAITTAASTPALFQFGQANNTASATPSFNFSAQSSGKAASVFPGSNPSFNFTAQKTESSTAAAAAPGLFKFGASQPAPANTPAFGSGSAFGSSSTPAFGSGSGTPGGFSGNVPSTTPAFGATPPAFGSSNASTGQAAPVFGGVFGNNSQPAAPAQSSAVFQFGAKPAESSQPAPSGGFNFSASANSAGLGPGSNFNFNSATSVNTFSATGTPPTDGRKIKKATRRLKR